MRNIAKIKKFNVKEIESQPAVTRIDVESEEEINIKIKTALEEMCPYHR